MPLDPAARLTPIDQAIQYTLAVCRSRLSRTALVKYVYLGDLKYAETHAGVTFTGAAWQFLHFGPWAAAVQERIRPAALAVGAEEVPFTTNKAEGEFLSYRLHDEGLAERLVKQLPWEVTSAIRWAVQEHGSNTSELLRLVYVTPPIVHAMPGQLLDFQPVASAPAVARDSEAGRVDAGTEELSAKDRRQRKALIEARKAEFRRRLRSASGHRQPAEPAPVYDEVFQEGTATLDSAAGPPALSPSSAEVKVHPGVWTSSSRRGEDG